MVYHNDIILETLMEELSKITLMEKSSKAKKRANKRKQKRNDQKNLEQQKKQKAIEDRYRMNPTGGTGGAGGAGGTGGAGGAGGTGGAGGAGQPKVQLFRATKEKVISIFNELNQKFFSKYNYFLNPNETTFEMTFITDTKNYGYFHYEGKDNKTGRLKNPKISINQDYQYSDKLLRSVVAHEMIHYVQALYKLKNDKEEIEHDDFFMDWAYCINSELGLEVSDRVDLARFQEGNPEVGKPASADFDNGQGNIQINPKVFELMSDMVKNFGGRVKHLRKNTNTDVFEHKVFYSNYLRFTNAMIVAMQRCIQARTLNEAQGGEVVGTPDFVQNYIKGFTSGNNSVRNATNNAIRRWQYQKYGSRFDKNGNIVLGDNTKLKELLTQYYPPLRQHYLFILQNDQDKISSDNVIEAIVDETDYLCKIANINISQSGQNDQQQDQGRPQGQEQDQQQGNPNDDWEPEWGNPDDWEPEWEQPKGKSGGDGGAPDPNVGGGGTPDPNAGGSRNEDFIREVEDYLFALFD